MDKETESQESQVVRLNQVVTGGARLPESQMADGEKSPGKQDNFLLLLRSLFNGEEARTLAGQFRGPRGLALCGFLLSIKLEIGGRIETSKFRPLTVMSNPNASVFLGPACSPVPA